MQRLHVSILSRNVAAINPHIEVGYSQKKKSYQKRLKAKKTEW
jgi:hypothetical protein